VNFIVSGDKIVVNYDIANCPPKKQYDITVRFFNENHKFVYPESIVGDINKIKCGSGKTISWDVLKDTDEFSGRMTAVVGISKSYSIRTPGGPSNALLSILVPGLGAKYVTTGQNKWYVRTILVYGLVGAGIGCKLVSNSQYEKYHRATDQESMNKYYDMANVLNKTFYVLIGAGTLVWLYDIIWVAVKGSKNKKSGGFGFNYNSELDAVFCSYSITL